MLLTCGWCEREALLPGPADGMKEGVQVEEPAPVLGTLLSPGIAEPQPAARVLLHHHEPGLQGPLPVLQLQQGPGSQEVQGVPAPVRLPHKQDTRRRRS